MAAVILEKVYKRFPSLSKAEGKRPQGVAVLRSIDLTVEDGEFMVLVGPSGCGKSTLLRLIAGLETVTAGTISVGDRRVNDLPPKDRNIAMVFQSYALYPHLTVFDNLAFGLRRSDHAPGLNLEKDNYEATAPWQTALSALSRPLPAFLRYQTAADRQIQQQVERVAQRLQISELLDRLPRQLSGGQKQRVALGRAIARNPQAFLMDEPLSNLDAKLRTETRTQIVELQRNLGITTIYVTHDQTEAMTMGDRIAVMNQGEIQQIAAPLELYSAPANRFVAEFIGSPPMNFLTFSVQAPTTLCAGEFRYTLPTEWAELLGSSSEILVGIRPEHLHLSPPATKNLAVQVTVVEALGHETFLRVQPREFPAVSLSVRVPAEERVQLGDELWLGFEPEQIHFFDPQTETRLAV
ncbi:MAG: ABC transporter ATP-binding protein [Spirulina sp. SIO3F2]|nr:ABC transporter ATP-binding protein [Spirulina sp. SIO3F2]